MPESNPLYEPLPATPQPSIRLLHISPSIEPDNPIICTLSIHSLTPDLKFTALSYEWGRPHKPTKDHPALTLEVNNRKVKVQPNLYHALSHLRSKETELVIWIDAICINQDDNDEKIQQVPLMAELYGRAERTFAWIGVGTDDSDVAMTVMETVGRGMLDKSNKSENLKGGGETEEGESALEEFERLTAGAAAWEWNLQKPDELLKLVPDLMEGDYLPNASFPVAECRGLLSREYWSRMWIQQEVVISSNVVVCCGHSSIGWEVFEAGLVFIMLLMHQAVYGVISKYKSRNDGAVWDFSKWTDAERKNYELLSPPWSVEAFALRRLRGRYCRTRTPQDNRFSLMRVVVEAHCNSNVRYEVSWHQDRIYGLAGMAVDMPHLKKFGFKVEYGVPCTDSYTNAARSMILSGGVDLLALSNFPKVERMPSWVPDWRVPVRMPRGGFPWETQFCVTRDLHGPENISHHAEWDDPLVLTGCVVDVVDHMNSPWQPGDVGSRLQSRQTLGYLLDVQNIIWMAGERQKKLEKPIYPDSNAMLTLLWMLVGDQLQAGTSVPPEERTEYLTKGFIGVVTDLVRKFVLDTNMWMAFLAPLGVNVERYSALRGMKAPPLTEETTAEFNAKDSYYNMMNRQSGTRPFVGDGGYIGLVPSLAERGDVVVIFRGAKFPYVLRKKANGKHAGRYELVGEAYVYGVMYGEFVADEPEWQSFEMV